MSITTIVFVFIRDLIYHNLSIQSQVRCFSRHSNINNKLQTGGTDCFRRGRRLPYQNWLSVLHRTHFMPCGKSKHVSVGVPVVAKDWMWMDMLPSIDFLSLYLIATKDSPRVAQRPAPSVQRPSVLQQATLGSSEDAQRKNQRLGSQPSLNSIISVPVLAPMSEDPYTQNPSHVQDNIREARRTTASRIAKGGYVGILLHGRRLFLFQQTLGEKLNSFILCSSISLRSLTLCARNLGCSPQPGLKA